MSRLPSFLGFAVSGCSSCGAGVGEVRRGSSCDSHDGPIDPNNVSGTQCASESSCVLVSGGGLLAFNAQKKSSAPHQPSTFWDLPIVYRTRYAMHILHDRGKIVFGKAWSDVPLELSRMEGNSHGGGAPVRARRMGASVRTRHNRPHQQPVGRSILGGARSEGPLGRFCFAQCSTRQDLPSKRAPSEGPLGLSRMEGNYQRAARARPVW